MNNIRQIKMIANTLNEKKQKYLFELSKLNKSITSKQLMISRMQTYQSDYLTNNHLELSKSIPGLHKNINLFIKKVENVITQAENEVNSLITLRSNILKTIRELDNKIKLMDIFQHKSNVELSLKEQRHEQAIHDDIAVMSIKGDDHG